jgi:hypothetical protein
LAAFAALALGHCGNAEAPIAPTAANSAVDATGSADAALGIDAAAEQAEVAQGAEDVGPAPGDSAGDAIQPGIDTAAPPQDTAPQTDATTPAPPKEYGLYDVKVSAVPGNPLACRVQWDTPLPADAVVSFGVGTFALRARDAQLKLHHDVLVYGMRAESTYRLVARSTTAQGLSAAAAEQQFTTAALPQGVQGAIVDVEAAEANPLEWVLTSVHLGQPAVGVTLGFPAAVIAYDQQGYPVWFMQMPKSNNVLAHWQPSGQVMLMAEETSGVFNMAGAAIWQWLSTFDLKGGGVLAAAEDGMAHHDMRLLPGGRVARLEFEVRDGKLGDRIVELDDQQKLLWSWSTLDHLNAEDWPGLNSVRMNADESQVLVSARNLSRVYCIQRSTGKVLWSAGNGGTLKLQAAAEASWFALQHDAQLLANGNLMVYDNGMPQRGYSRAAEYELNLSAGTAKQVWQAKGEPGDLWYSAGEGSAERWEDGRTLIAAPDFQTGFPALTRLMLFDPAGKITWQTRLTPFQGKLPMAYRAGRMVPPNLELMAPGDEP